MKLYTDWSRVRLGLLIGLVYAVILNGIGYAAGFQGLVFPGPNLGLLIAMGFYFAMGWWTARDARTHTEGLSQGMSLGLGIGLGVLVITMPLMIYLMSDASTFPWPVFIVAALFGELKWSAVALVGGRMRAGRNTPLV